MVDLEIDYEIEQIIAASPDYEDGRPQKVPFEVINGLIGKRLRFTITEIKIWTMIAIFFK